MDDLRDLRAHPDFGALVVWSIDTAQSQPHQAAMEALAAIVGSYEDAIEVADAGFAVVFDVYDRHGMRTRIDLAHREVPGSTSTHIDARNEGKRGW